MDHVTQAKSSQKPKKEKNVLLEQKPQTLNNCSVCLIFHPCCVQELRHF